MKNIINPSNIEAISKIGTTQISNEKQKNDLGNSATLEKTKITNNKKNVDNILDDNSIEDVKKNKKKPRIIKLNYFLQYIPTASEIFLYPSFLTKPLNSLFIL